MFHLEYFWERTFWIARCVQWVLLHFVHCGLLLKSLYTYRMQHNFDQGEDRTPLQSQWLHQPCHECKTFLSHIDCTAGGSEIIRGIWVTRERSQNSLWNFGKIHNQISCLNSDEFLKIILVYYILFWLCVIYVSGVLRHQRRVSSLLNWSGWLVWVTTWMLGIEHRSSARKNKDLLP